MTQRYWFLSSACFGSTCGSQALFCIGHMGKGRYVVWEIGFLWDVSSARNKDASPVEALELSLTGNVNWVNNKAFQYISGGGLLWARGGAFIGAYEQLTSGSLPFYEHLTINQMEGEESISLPLPLKGRPKHMQVYHSNNFEFDIMPKAVTSPMFK